MSSGDEKCFQSMLCSLTLIPIFVFVPVKALLSVEVLISRVFRSDRNRRKCTDNVWQRMGGTLIISKCLSSYLMGCHFYFSWSAVANNASAINIGVVVVAVIVVLVIYFTHSAVNEQLDAAKRCWKYKCLTVIKCIDDKHITTVAKHQFHLHWLFALALALAPFGFCSIFRCARIRGLLRSFIYACM